MVIKAENIRKSFGKLEVLKGCDFHINKGEMISVVGASGAGKSTLLHILGTLDRPDSGVIEYDGREVTRMGDKELSRFRNKEIGFVFQFHHLLPEFTALENICIPAFIARTDRKKAESRALELLSVLNLIERKDHKPATLSGGEQQRVAVARALINAPAIIMADEPSGNLDSAGSEELHLLFKKLQNELNQTFIIVTHNKELAGMADNTLIIRDGILG